MKQNKLGSESSFDLNSAITNTFLIISFVYSGLIGAVTLPKYLGFISPESFGLIGVVTFISSVVLMFELGIGTVLVSKISNATSEIHQSNYIQASFYIYFVGLTVLLIVSFFGFDLISAYTFRSVESAEPLFIVTFVTAAIRMCSIPFQSLIVAKKMLYRISFERIIHNSLKFLGGYVLLMYGSTVLEYVIYQLVVTILSLILLFYWSEYINLEKSKVGEAKEYVKKLIVSGGIVSYSMVVWTLYTQADKFVFVGNMKLDEYGYYMLLSSLVAAAISISAPMMQIIVPALNKSDCYKEDLVRYYSLFCLFGFAAITFVLANSNSLISFWLANEEAVIWISAYLRYYTFYIGFSVLLSFPYFVLLTKEKLKYHAQLHTFILFVLIPIVLVISGVYGINGIAVYWKYSSLIILVVWTGFIFHRILKLPIYLQIIYVVCPYLIAEFSIDLFDFQEFSDSFLINASLSLCVITGFWFCYGVISKKILKYRHVFT